MRIVYSFLQNILFYIFLNMYFISKYYKNEMLLKKKIVKKLGRGGVKIKRSSITFFSTTSLNSSDTLKFQNHINLGTTVHPTSSISTNKLPHKLTVSRGLAAGSDVRFAAATFKILLRVNNIANTKVTSA